MSENKFTPLIADLLRNLAGEIENNKAMAKRLARPFEPLLAETLSVSTAAGRGKAQKSTSRAKKYPVPEGFDPYKIFYDEGSPGLYRGLQALQVDELKGVLARFTTIPRKDYVRRQKQELLVEMAVQGVKEVATRGQAFADYKLDAE
jgi:hypothetical protein